MRRPDDLSRSKTISSELAFIVQKQNNTRDRHSRDTDRERVRQKQRELGHPER